MHISTYKQYKIEMRLGGRGKARPFSILCPKPHLLALSECSFQSRPGITVMCHHTQLKVCVCTFTPPTPLRIPRMVACRSLAPAWAHLTPW